MNITEHFTYEELTRTSQPYDNAPPRDALINMCFLAHRVLEPLRAAVGVPVHINSAYRSRRVNDAVGGVSNSYHLLGLAADIPYTSDTFAGAVVPFLKTCRYVDLALLENKGGVKWFHVQTSANGVYRRILRF